MEPTKIDPAKKLEEIKRSLEQNLPNTRIEHRFFPGLEIRADEGDDDMRRLEGYAAVFNQESEGLWFIEKIAKGAFEESLKQDDIVGLFNHDRNNVLSRNTASTMVLEEDDRGLKYIMDLDDTPVADTVFKNVKRGDVKGSSFSFQTLKDEWDYSEDGEVITRTLLKVKLYDVGPVTFPAYPDTTVATRSLDKWLKEQQAAKPIIWRREIARRKLDLAVLK